MMYFRYRALFLSHFILYICVKEKKNLINHCSNATVILSKQRKFYKFLSVHSMNFKIHSGVDWLPSIKCHSLWVLEFIYTTSYWNTRCLNWNMSQCAPTACCNFNNWWVITHYLSFAVSHWLHRWDIWHDKHTESTFLGYIKLYILKDENFMQTKKYR